ncbi:MAG TPA: ribonuclease J [Acidimicrobiia bacterium]|nr:ribonuclease J [Acidimicrobiia bacterium]
MAEPTTRVTFLGGLGDIGRNCAAIEVDGRILLLDIGLMFPGPEMPGVDLVLPQLSWLRERADRIDGILLTHAHEDHTGGLAFLLRELGDRRIPVYSAELTLQMASGRLEEAGVMDRAEMIPVADGERRRIGPAEATFVPVTHSVPHGFAIAIDTPAGRILHSGDFKLDPTPVDGRLTDLGLLGALAEDGVDLFLSDSTNADEPGSTPSETTVGAEMDKLFAQYDGKRIIAACFSSHLHRIQQIAQAALDSGRTIAFLGRSMGRNVDLGRRIGLLHIPESRVVDIADAHKFDPGDLCVICTGSQGEPLSALALMAARESRFVQVGPDDVIILSAHAIPGNEANVNRIINGFFRLGAEVVHPGVAPVHVSGHACRDELLEVLDLVRPKALVPVHGEFRHLVSHARLGRQAGVGSIEVCEDGDSAVLTPDGLRVEKATAPSGYLFVHGVVGDVGEGVLRDRRVLSEEGVVVVFVTVDAHSGEIVTGPEIVTRGWVYAPEAEHILVEAEEAVRKSIAAAAAEGAIDPETLRRHARQALRDVIRERTRRRPIVIPVVLEV